MRERSRNNLDKKKIWRCAMIWEALYRNHANVHRYIFIEPEFLGEELAELGFVMDCGESVKQAFPNIDFFNDNRVLRQNIEKLNIQQLGNLIFSQWRYWNHWSMGPMQDEDYEWFVIAFGQLIKLAR